MRARKRAPASCAFVLAAGERRGDDDDVPLSVLPTPLSGCFAFFISLSSSLSQLTSLTARIRSRSSVVWISMFVITYKLDRCNPWPHVASCCYLFTVFNSGLLSVQRPRPANQVHFRHSQIPEFICGFNSSIDRCIFFSFRLQLRSGSCLLNGYVMSNIYTD